MQTFLKRRKLFLMCVLLTVCSLNVFSQADGGTPKGGFPFILLIAYALGVIAHWVKKYTKDGVQVPLTGWLFSNFGWTMGSLVVGLSAVWSIYMSNPASMDAGNIGSWITVFMTAMGADTLNESTVAIVPK